MTARPEPDDHDSGVRVERQGAVANLELRNTGRRNAVTHRLVSELDDALARLADDTDVAVVVVRGEGKDFCVGADLRAPSERRVLRGRSPEDDVARLQAATEVVVRLRELPQVTIAAVRGGCAGAGLSLALAADFRVAARSAVFNTAFVDVGVSGDFGGIWFAQRLLGQRAARRLYLDPRRVTAPDAVELGLVDEVADDDVFDDAVAAWAGRLAAKAPLALRAAKQNLLDADTLDLSAYVPGEVARMVRTTRSADAKEAGAAFLEKRAPRFTGR